MSFLREKNTEHEHFLIFETDTKESAVNDLHRWILDRQKCVTWYFTALLAVKISPYYISRIEGSGSCITQAQIPFYEWKADYPYPFDGKIRS
jgi:hypothetical protein